MTISYNTNFFPLFLLLIMSFSPVSAQPLQKIGLPDIYTYHPGDSLHWVEPDYNDQHWEVLKYGTFPVNNWQGVGWFRFVLAVDSSLWNVPLGFRLRGFGAAEIYLNGRLLYRLGKIGSSPQAEVAVREFIPHPFIIAPPPDSSRLISRPVIAIRYSKFYLQNPAWSGVTPIINVEMGNLYQMNRDIARRTRMITWNQMLLTGVFLSFAIIHLLLFIFYPEPRANLFFAFFSGFGAMAVFFLFRNFLTDTPDDYIRNFRLYEIGLTLLALFGIRFTYAIMYRKIPRMFYIFLAIAIILCVAVWLRPIEAGKYVYLYTLLLVPETMRNLAIVYFKKRKPLLEGSKIIGWGAIPLLLTGVYQIFISLGVFEDFLPSFMVFPRPFYAMLVLMVSMSFFLARNVARINRNLEKQLEQVKTLSEKTLRQELERAELEAENARKTRELEEARQLQLSMLPKTIPRLRHLSIAVRMQTATEVGGDYYDFHLGDDGVLTVAFGDATGHGLQAGTMVAATKSLFNALAPETSPLTILQKMSLALKAMGFRGMYMAMMIVKVTGRQLRVSSAGMPYMLLYDAASREVKEIELKGMPLGSFPDFSYQQTELQLKKGDTILLMSDGFPELFNNTGEMLGDERARAYFAEAVQHSPDEIITHLMEKAHTWAN